MSSQHIWRVTQTSADTCGNEDYSGESEYYQGSVMRLLRRFQYDLNRVYAYRLPGQQIPTERLLPHPTKGYGTWINNPHFNAEEIPHATWFKIGGFSGHEFEVINVQQA